MAQVALTIGIISGDIIAAGAGPGQVLSNDGFDPQPTTDGTLQDIVLTTPTNLPSGDATLTVFHVSSAEVRVRSLVPTLTHSDMSSLTRRLKAASRMGSRLSSTFRTSKLL